MKNKTSKKALKTKKIVDEIVSTPFLSKLQEEYKATVKVLGQTYQATGTTVKEAISKLTPKNCKGKSILIVEKGEVKREKVLMPVLTFRLFSLSRVTREIALKNVVALFAGI